MKYNIPKYTINDWFRDIDKYKNQLKQVKKLPLGGRKSKLLTMLILS